MYKSLKTCFVIALLALGLPSGTRRAVSQSRTAARPSALTRPRLIVQTGSESVISEMTFSPDSRYVATVDFSGNIILWDIAGHQLRRLQGYSISDIAISADNRFLAVTGQGDVEGDSGITLHNIATGAARHYNFPKQKIDSITLSPKGELILLRIGSEEFGPEGLIVWDATRKRIIRRFDNGIAGVFSPDGRTLIISVWASKDKQTISYALQSWNVNRWTRNWENVSMGRRLGVRDKFAISPDGKSLLATSLRDDYGYELFNTATGAFVTHGVCPYVKNPDQQPSHTFLLRCSISPAQNYYLIYEGSSGGTAGNYSNTVYLYDFQKEILVSRLERTSRIVEVIRATSPERNWLFIGDVLGNAYLWDLSEGKEVRRFIAPLDDGSSEQNAGGEEVEEDTGQSSGSVADISADGRYVINAPYGGTGYIWDGTTGNLIREIGPNALSEEESALSISLSADGERAVLDRCWELSLIRLPDAGHIWDKELIDGECGSLAELRSMRNSTKLSPDANYVLTRSAGKGHVAFLNAHNGEVINSFPITGGYPLALSPDSRSAAVSYTVSSDDQREPESFLALLDTFGGRIIKRLRMSATPMSFTPDSKSLLALSDRALVLIDVATGNINKQIPLGDDVSPSYVCYSPDGRFILIGDTEGSVRFYDPEAERDICRLFSFRDGSWLVVAPDGRFDTNNLEEIKGLVWIMPDTPLTALPLEIFMRDYYEPRLLARLLARESLPELPDLSQLNRVQPFVNITSISQPDASATVKVIVEVGNAEEKFQRDGKQIVLTTSVYDLRLFRDGQLVGYTLGDGGGKLPPERATSREEELRQWRRIAEIKELDSVTGRRTLTFDVHLPRGQDVSQIEFTAYAFNQDRVKSETSRWRWPNAVKPKLPKAQEVKRRAYVITVGVNASQVESARLQYAASDARLTQRVLGESLKNRYEVISVPLIADDELLDGRRVEVRDATKAKIKAVLNLLAGSEVNEKLKLSIPNAQQLSKATPDDLVLISFSGHGYADPNGNFYLLPFDVLNSTDSKQRLPDLTSCISSEELSMWLRDVDGGEMVMIIDACHAAAFTGSGFKPGPMGSRGLGQLSYDKGMRILAATQAGGAAIEAGGKIQQGLLSYALLKEGLDQRRANFKLPDDGKITLREWLEFGVKEVPNIYQLIISGQLKAVGRDAIMDNSDQNRNNQRPSLFDFSRRHVDITIMDLMSR